MRVTPQRLADALRHGPRLTLVKAASEQRYVLGVGYWAGPRDQIGTGADGGRDFISAVELEKSAWGYIKKGSRVGLFHAEHTEGHADVVESYIYRGPDWHIIDTTGRTQVIKAGDWLVGMILDPIAWDLYKTGQLDGLSPQGRARRRQPGASDA